LNFVGIRILLNKREDNGTMKVKVNGKCQINATRLNAEMDNLPDDLRTFKGYKCNENKLIGQNIHDSHQKEINIEKPVSSSENMSQPEMEKMIEIMSRKLEENKVAMLEEINESNEKMLQRLDER
jgi:hypothetical protein